MKRVIIESPYAAPTASLLERNIDYARAALLDCLRKGEAPIASHLLFTQVLDDTNPRERALGIEAGLCWGKFAELTVVYADLGISPGMQQGIDRAHAEKRPVEVRFLRDWSGVAADKVRP